MIIFVFINFQNFIQEEKAGAEFFELGGQEDLDDDLLGGALEPEGEETVEANGGRTHYLLEEDIHIDDLNEEGYKEYSLDESSETNGHELSSQLAEKLYLKQRDDNLSKVIKKSNCKQPPNKINLRKLFISIFPYFCDIRIA